MQPPKKPEIWTFERWQCYLAVPVRLLHNWLVTRVSVTHELPPRAPASLWGKEKTDLLEKLGSVSSREVINGGGSGVKRSLILYLRPHINTMCRENEGKESTLLLAPYDGSLPLPSPHLILTYWRILLHFSDPGDGEHGRLERGHLDQAAQARGIRHINSLNNRFIFDFSTLNIQFFFSIIKHLYVMI